MKAENTANLQPKSRWLPALVIATVALVGGIGANIWLSTGTSTESVDAQSDAELKQIQEQLVATTILPDNFKSVPAFELIGANNTAVTDALFADKWSMVFFGFTHCPDVCPTTLYVMNSVIDELREQSLSEPQVVFITVDPVRDTIDKVTDYVNYFSDEFVGLSGTLNNITQLTSKLGVVASFTASETDPNNYTVDHTASMLLIDPQKNLRAKFGAPHEVDSIVKDFKTIIASFQ